jgi:hypothetical protein
VATWREQTFTLDLLDDSLQTGKLIELQAGLLGEELCRAAVYRLNDGWRMMVCAIVRQQRG